MKQRVALDSTAVLQRYLPGKYRACRTAPPQVSLLSGRLRKGAHMFYKSSQSHPRPAFPWPVHALADHRGYADQVNGHALDSHEWPGLLLWRQKNHWLDTEQRTVPFFPLTPDGRGRRR